MTILADRQYTLDLFFKLENINIDDFISKDCIDIINRLAEQVGAPTYNKTPNFKKKNNYRIRRKEMDWTSLRNYKKTELVKEKDIIQQKILVIKDLLNKMTPQKSKKDLIIENINIIIKDKPEELENVALLIYEIASSNKFYSKMYAKLYKELTNKFEIMKKICFNHFSHFLNLFVNIEYVEAEEDYTKFCEINKINEKRRAMSLFFVNLMMEELIDVDLIIDLILSLQSKLLFFIDENNKKKVVEEISESLFLIICNGKKKLKEHNNVMWNEILKNLKNITKIKPRDKKSLTSKVIFQYYDIIEA